MFLPDTCKVTSPHEVIGIDMHVPLLSRSSFLRLRDLLNENVILLLVTIT